MVFQFRSNLTASRLIKFVSISTKIRKLERGRGVLMLPPSPSEGNPEGWSHLYQTPEQDTPPLSATKVLQSEFASNTLIKSQTSFLLALTELLILCIYQMQNFCAITHLSVLFLDSTYLIGGCSSKTQDKTCYVRLAWVATGSIWIHEQKCPQVALK